MSALAAEPTPPPSPTGAPDAAALRGPVPAAQPADRPLVRVTDLVKHFPDRKSVV